MIRELDAPRTADLIDSLIALLQDSVNAGASLGFLPPLAKEEAKRYWLTVASAIADGTCILLADVDGWQVHGCVQLGLETRPNGSHRAEVMKLMVLRRLRRRGIGRALMEAIEDQARTRGRRLLVLDTRWEDPAEHLYAAMGYIRAGIIPRYARDGSGVLRDTVFFYKELS
jgi:GNAT superfamily N-acetyltransferase